jgi:hypothetical protein
MKVLLHLLIGVAPISALAAQGQALLDEAGHTKPIDVSTEAEYVANGCPYLTYYKLSHERYMAVPLAYAQKYGPVIGATRMLDYRCAGGINVNNATQHEPTQASNATTESMSIKDVIASHSMNTIKLDKRFVFGWAAVAAFWKGIGFASKLFSTACIATSTFFSGTKANTAVCVLATISGAVDLASGLINTLRTSGGAVGTVTSNSYTSYNVYTQGNGYEAWNNVKRDANDPLHAWLQSHSGLRHAHGRNHTNLEILTANESHPVIWHHPVSGAEGATWVVPHPFNSSRNIVTVKPTLRRAVKNENHNQKEKRDGCIGEDNGEYTICESRQVIEPSAIVGLDMYGGPGPDWNVDNAVGGEGSARNGEGQFMSLASGSVNEYQSWENCLCFQDDNTWVGTGSVQYTWDGVYNGYSTCWAAECDLAALSG